MRNAVWVVILVCLAVPLAAAPPPTPALPSWFPPPNGAYEVQALRHTAWDSWTFLTLAHSTIPRVGAYNPVAGEVWKFELGHPKPNAKSVWASIRSRLEQQGFRVVQGDPKDADPGIMALQKGDDAKATFVEYWNRSQLAIIAPAANPFRVALTPPEPTRETFGPKDDVPYVTPIAGSRLLRADKGTIGLTVSTDCKALNERRGTVTADREYAMPPDLSDAALEDAYRTAFRAAGWTDLCTLGRWLVAHYTRNGRDVWAKVVSSAPRSYSVSVADTGAGLREDLKANCKAPLYGVNFDFNKATVRADAEPALAQLLSLLNEESKLVVEIGGHTDDIGKPADNLRLSDERAAAVRQWLVAHGIAASRLTSRGYGETQPLVPNANDENRARNRRVEVKRTDCR